MRRSSSSDRDSLSESEVQEILRRAVEIDDRPSAGLTLDDLRRIAGEVGISETAIEKALAEHVDPTLRPSRTAESESWVKRLLSRTQRRFRLVGITAAALVGGMLLRDVYGPLEAEHLVALLVLGFASIRCALHHRRENNHDAYQAENAGVWLAFIGGWSLVHGGYASELVILAGSMWIVMSALGSWIVGTGKPIHVQEEPSR